MLYSCCFFSLLVVFLSFFTLSTFVTTTSPSRKARLASSLPERWALRDNVVSLQMLSGPKTMPREFPRAMNLHVATEAPELGSEASEPALSWGWDTQQRSRQLVKIAWSTDLSGLKGLESRGFSCFCCSEEVILFHYIYLHWSAFSCLSLGGIISNWSSETKGQFNPLNKSAHIKTELILGLEYSLYAIFFKLGMCCSRLSFGLIFWLVCEWPPAKFDPVKSALKQAALDRPQEIVVWYLVYVEISKIITATAVILFAVEGLKPPSSTS